MNRTTAAAPCGVAWPTVSATQTRAPGPDGRRIQRAQRVRVRARRVFGHVHDRQPLADREGDRLLGELQQLIERPALGVLAQRARPDEGAALDRHPGALRDLRDRPDVGDHRPRRAVRLRPSAADPRSRARGAPRPGRRAGRRPAGRCRPSRSRADRSGEGSGASPRSSGSGPTATAARRAASRRPAARSAAWGLGPVPVVDQGMHQCSVLSAHVDRCAS